MTKRHEFDQKDLNLLKKENAPVVHRKKIVLILVSITKF